jgi:branched-chain amino acid transport system ATP-binding protein
VQGQVVFRGHAITHWPAYERARLGLGYVPEDRRLFASLTVQENLLVAARLPTAQMAVPGRLTTAQQLEQVFALFPVLKPMQKRRAQEMSGGEQQMLSIARTLMTSPRCFCWTSPAKALHRCWWSPFAEGLLALRSQGMAMLVAEQNALLAAHADRVITLAGQTPLEHLNHDHYQPTGHRPLQVHHDAGGAAPVSRCAGGIPLQMPQSRH